MATIQQVQNVVPARGTLVLTAGEREAILEIAYLAIWADHKLRDEEIAAFRAVASRLRDLVAKDGAASGELSDRDLNAILDRFAKGLERAEADERLRVLCAGLTRTAPRGLAYKLAYALSLCDLETTDEEFEFDLQLIDSLKLTQDEASTLADEVHDVFGSVEET